jgi:hypothetical protein
VVRPGAQALHARAEVLGAERTVEPLLERPFLLGVPGSEPEERFLVGADGHREQETEESKEVLGHGTSFG